MKTKNENPQRGHSLLIHAQQRQKCKKKMLEIKKIYIFFAKSRKKLNKKKTRNTFLKEILKTEKKRKRKSKVGNTWRIIKSFKKVKNENKF